MVVTYYIKLFRMGADRHSGILMSSPSSRRDKDCGLEVLAIWLLKLLNIFQYISSNIVHGQIHVSV